MAAQQLLKIVYALDIKFWVRWCTCSMWRMLLPYYLLFLISIILFLKTDIYDILSRTELARLVMGTIFLVIVPIRYICLFVYIYVTRSEKTYHFTQKLKKRYKQKSRRKSFFNPKLFLAYLKFQLLGYLLAKFQHLKRQFCKARRSKRAPFFLVVTADFT